VDSFQKLHDIEPGRNRWSILLANTGEEMMTVIAERLLAENLKKGKPEWITSQTDVDVGLQVGSPIGGPDPESVSAVLLVTQTEGCMVLLLRYGIRCYCCNQTIHVSGGFADVPIILKLLLSQAAAEPGD
jgi:hypothetical protein